MKKGFSLVEVLIVVLVIGILMAIAVPQWARTREETRKKACHQNIRAIELAKDQFMIELRKHTGEPVGPDDLWPRYITGPHFPRCPGSGAYAIGVLGEQASCNVHPR
jgi:prepilin-type N-terminal cleavage/methylation domain-containing protein